MRWRLAGGAWSAWSEYAHTSAITLPDVDGIYVVDIAFLSDDGEQLEASHSITLALPQAGESPPIRWWRHLRSRWAWLSTD